MNLHILGIRHHGVGSAKNVSEAIKTLQPDIILVEGPPELDLVIPYVIHKEMKPPVSVLAYNEDKPSQAVFYPFAKFSPEWQAITFALNNNIPVRMMDLPLSHSFGLEIKKQIELEKELEKKRKKEEEKDLSNEENNIEKEAKSQEFEFPPEKYKDPISYLSELAGYSDSELWWEHQFEHKYIKGSAIEHFEAVMLSMEALREHIDTPSSDRDERREAYMRKLIRQAEKDGFQNCVVVCGAWHGPALQLSFIKKSEKEDEKLLKNLPTAKVNSTWIPWTNARLSFFSGYGAGIMSPGWYEHLWNHPDDKGIRWLTRVAKLFREKKMDTSTAHIIEAFRLAEALASMRDLSHAGLMEFNEATKTVICFGNEILLKLVEEELIVAKNIGKVPQDVPKLPLQSDFEFQYKKYRLEIIEAYKEYQLDLRKELDLNRSRLLHRLDILGINWGKKQYANTKGTFKEVWGLKWTPEMMISLVEMGIWGNTIEEACTKYILDKSQKSQSITEIASFIQLAIPAELFSVIERLLEKINELSTISSDILELMTALVPLVDVSRYGNVRKTDLTAINTLVDGLLTRVCIGLPNACYGLDDETSNRMFENIKKVDDCVRLLNIDDLESLWYKTLTILLNKQGVNPIITGCTCRLLFDGKIIDETETARNFGLALSVGTEPKDAAGWLEGFLKGSGVVLLFDNVLWNILNKWIVELEKEKFVELLPILRRTFSKFEIGERKQLGEKAKRGTETGTFTATTLSTEEFINIERAEKSLDVIKLLLGIN